MLKVRRERGATLEKRASQQWQGVGGRKLNITIIADTTEHSLGPMLSMHMHLSFKTQNNCEIGVPLLNPFYRLGSLGTERVRGFPKVTKLVRVRAEIQPKSSEL